LVNFNTGVQKKAGSSGATSQTIPPITGEVGNPVAFRDAISLYSNSTPATSTA
jgi:hypothetical protein